MTEPWLDQALMDLAYRSGDRIYWIGEFAKLPTTGSNSGSPIQIVMNIFLLIGNSGIEPTTFLQFVKSVHTYLYLTLVCRVH